MVWHGKTTETGEGWENGMGMIVADEEAAFLSRHVFIVLIIGGGGDSPSLLDRLLGCDRSSGRLRRSSHRLRRDTSAVAVLVAMSVAVVTPAPVFVPAALVLAAAAALAALVLVALDARDFAVHLLHAGVL